MKNLNEMLNEALNINESAVDYRDFDNVYKVLDNNSKLKKFIKDHESEATEEGFGSSDISDIENAMIEIHTNLSELDSADDREDYLEDCISSIADSTGADEDMIEVAIDFYKTLFKEITHKSLDD